MPKRRWKQEPDEHDYPAAVDYLSLVFPDDVAEKIVDSMKDEPIVHRKAKDLLRASDLPILPPDNVHVASDLTKIRKGQKLSPAFKICSGSDGPASFGPRIVRSA